MSETTEGRPRGSAFAARRLDRADDGEVSLSEDRARKEQAALVGLAASFFAIASGAALGTSQSALRWAAVVTFFASASLAVWARRVLGTSAPHE